MEIFQEEGRTFTLHFLEIMLKHYRQALRMVAKRGSEKKASSYNHIILGY
jgi:uncharacterized protein (DUF305 family)